MFIIQKPFFYVKYACDLDNPMRILVARAEDMQASRCRIHHFPRLRELEATAVEPLPSVASPPPHQKRNDTKPQLATPILMHPDLTRLKVNKFFMAEVREHLTDIRQLFQIHFNSEK